MSRPAHLDFRVEPVSPKTGNLLPILHQLRHALDQLLEQGQESSIDLRSLPLSSAEEQELIDLLGRGEVEATLESQGPSSFQESRFPGVWLCIHRNQEGEALGKFIEICRIPALLKSQPEDMREGLSRLQRQLGEMSP